ncbi:MAG: nitrilase-related carbon-nitrogen hydrolase, partial [Deferrisomatales bacterium]
MSTALTLALAQVGGSPDPGANLATARRLAAQAGGADLLCVPEMFMAVPAPDEPLDRVAEPLDGPFVRGLAALARQRGLHLL